MTANKKRLTDAVVKRTKPPAEGYVIVWDSLCPGLGLRINSGGKRAFIVQGRCKGKNFKTSVGNALVIGLEQARNDARGVLEDAQRGIAPAKRKALDEEIAKVEKREAQKAEAGTFRAVAEEYMRYHGNDLKSSYELNRYLAVDILPVFGDLPIGDINRHDLRSFVLDKSETAPISAARCISLIRPILNYALDEGYIDDLPSFRKLTPKTTERDRVLTDDELKSVWLAADAIGYPYGALIKFLALTGCRRGEAAGLTWSEIDGDIWKLPSERSKNGEGHLIPLTPFANSILDDCPRFKGCNLVFNNGGKQLSGFSKYKVRHDRVISEQRGEPFSEPWRVHDIRRSVATGLRSLGIDRLTVSKILNHSEGGVTKIYDRYAADPEKRHALEVWAAHLESLVTGTPTPSNVVEIRKGA